VNNVRRANTNQKIRGRILILLKL